MSVKDTYIGWRTTLIGLIVQGIIGYVWIKGIQPIEIWSVTVFLAGFGLWLMPDKVIELIKKKLNAERNSEDGHY